MRSRFAVIIAVVLLTTPGAVACSGAEQAEKQAAPREETQPSELLEQRVGQLEQRVGQLEQQAERTQSQPQGQQPEGATGAEANESEQQIIEGINKAREKLNEKLKEVQP